VLAGLAAGVPAYFTYLGLKMANERLKAVVGKQESMEKKQDQLHILVNSQTERVIDIEKKVSLKEGQAEGNAALMAAEKEVSRLMGKESAAQEQLRVTSEAGTSAEG